MSGFFMAAFINLKYTSQTLRLALPVMITQLGQVSVNIFDNIIVGKMLGADALASVALANSVFFTIVVCIMGFSLAMPPLISEADAKKDSSYISTIFQHGMVINVALGILSSILLLLGLPLLFELKQPPHIIPDTLKFLEISAYTIIPFMIFQTYRETAEGLGCTAQVTKATILGNIINILLNYTFIKGLFGLTPMGVQGSSLATFISRILMLVFLVIILLKHPKVKNYIQVFSFKVKDYSKSTFKRLLGLGFPTAMQMLFEVSAFAGASFICGLVSSRDIAAHQIALSVASATFNLGIGFSVASTIMVGNKLGEKDFNGLRQVGINNLKIVFLFMALCGLGIILARKILPEYFTQTKDIGVVLIATKLLIVAALFQLSDGLQVTVLGCLRGIQDVKIPSIITGVAYWLIAIPLGYFLCITMGMGTLGMWIALGIGLTLSASLLIVRFLKKSKSNLTEQDILTNKKFI